MEERDGEKEQEDREGESSEGRRAWDGVEEGVKEYRVRQKYREGGAVREGGEGERIGMKEMGVTCSYSGTMY